MLIRLKIQNLILVEKADIAFGTGLNILTGETGAGKSAVLSAIRLIAGDRAETQLIGKFGDLAVVEASLSTYTLPEEIDPPSQGEPLWIRREIHRSGKSRAFANDQLISLALLRQIAGSSIELVDQSSSHALAAADEQRKVLDAFANLSSLAEELADSFALESAERKKVEELSAAQERRSRDLAWAEEDLSLIEEVNWKAGEDESLFSEHQLLVHSQELLDKLGAVESALAGHPLKKAALLLDACARIDARLAPQNESLKSALLEVDEAHADVRTYLSRLDSDPNRLSILEERISAIEQLKRRFGKTLVEVEAKKKELLSRIDRLNHLDEELASAQNNLKLIAEKNLALSASLSEGRKKAAGPFSAAVLKELKKLNLPSSQFLLSLAPKPLSSSGIDEIRFLFSANIGHEPIPLEKCASGGELSRLLLAIKTVLADKDETECLIFDEIDSNVGGQTASVLGEKLKEISQNKQVICVTHFAQVARVAAHHFLVQKSAKAITTIAALKPSERESEYQRMQGMNPIP